MKKLSVSKQYRQTRGPWRQHTNRQLRVGHINTQYCYGGETHGTRTGWIGNQNVRDIQWT